MKHKFEEPSTFWRWALVFKGGWFDANQEWLSFKLIDLSLFPPLGCASFASRPAVRRF
jgi:hypothetical protein